MAQMSKNIRALAARCCFAVVDQGRSLSEELPKLQQLIEGKDKGLLQELCYGVIRYLPELESHVLALVTKPLTGKQRVFHFLMLVGIYQLKYTRIPDHAAVAETVAACQVLKNRHLKGLINGVLRNYQRQAEELSQTKQSDPIKYSHPGWFIKKIQAAYPEQWQQILSANMEKPPMWLRVNQQKSSLESYQGLLKAANIEITNIDNNSGAILLSQPIDVTKLPHFSDGWVSIQDGAAQQAAGLLNAKADDNVLDCCAAPGGKTCHILELTPDIAQMTALDVEQERLTRVEDNLKRLGLTANIIAGDAAAPDSWWDGKLFNKILLDAPCSGTGVIRRHPDIKWLRRASDIESLVQLQAQIIDAIWPLLAPGGTLIYATCSILPQENKEQIKGFITRTPDAILKNITDQEDSIGWQILPGEQSMDGFYYAKLLKAEQKTIT
jgi:16S rRNA (cytosine967-C5)-methyltransferase